MVGVLEVLPPLVVLLVASVLVAGETAVVVGLVFPVEITLLFVGFLTHLGALPLVPVTGLLVVAALVGDVLALRSGRRHGPRVRRSRFGRRVGPHRWARAERWLRRYGGRSAVLARWVPFVRTLLPRLAGSAGVSRRRYLGWDVVGVVSAVGSSVVVGNLVGASYVRAWQVLGQVVWVVVLLAVLAVAGVLGVRRLAGRCGPRAAVGANLGAHDPS